MFLTRPAARRQTSPSCWDCCAERSKLPDSDYSPFIFRSTHALTSIYFACSPNSARQALIANSRTAANVVVVEDAGQRQLGGRMILVCHASYVARPMRAIKPKPPGRGVMPPPAEDERYPIADRQEILDATSGQRLVRLSALPRLCCKTLVETTAEP